MRIQKEKYKRKVDTFFSMQVIDFRDVYFQSLSSHKVLCPGAKPSPRPVPEKLLQLVPKVMYHFPIIV